MLIAVADAPRHETPNAVMVTLAAPSLGATELAVWEVSMRAGQQGPQHTVDREQVWTILDGDLTVDIDGEIVVAHAGETLRIGPHVPRRVTATTDARSLVAGLAGSVVSTPDGACRPLPWAA